MEARQMTLHELAGLINGLYNTTNGDRPVTVVTPEGDCYLVDKVCLEATCDEENPEQVVIYLDDWPVPEPID